MNNPKTVLITGATSGIGLACAQKFAQQGYQLVLIGRRADRLADLLKSIPTKAITFQVDVSDKEEVKQAIANIPSQFLPIDILINNAGLAAGFDKIQDGNLNDWEQMIDTNVKGLLYVSKEVMPIMISQGNGHIINISSTAAKDVYEKGNVYCATKYAVDAISKSMRIDLLEHGIKVTNIAPGMVETEFSEVRFKGDTEKAKKVYQGLKPLSPADVADVIFFTATLPAHVCINDLTLTALAQANAIYTHRN